MKVVDEINNLLANLNAFGTWLRALPKDYYFWQQEGFTPLDAWLDEAHPPFSHYITGNCEVTWHDVGERVGYIALPDKAVAFMWVFRRVVGEGPGEDRVDAATCVELWSELWDEL
jgi:hypothetical protein